MSRLNGYNSVLRMSAARSYTRKTLGIIHVRYQFWFRSDCGASTIIKKLGNKESLFSKELEKNSEIKIKIHAKNEFSKKLGNKENNLEINGNKRFRRRRRIFF